MIFERDSGGAVLKLKAGVVRLLWSHRQIGSRPESGGVLVGRRLLEGGACLVDDASPPALQDTRGRFHFERSRKPHQDFVDASWARSDGTSHYLGEWHTHPERRPTPSIVDLEDWRRLVRECEYPGDGLFFVIVGTEDVRAWSLPRDGVEPERLKLRGEM